MVDENADQRLDLEPRRGAKATAGPTRRHRVRGIAAAVLVVLTSISVLAAVVGAWVQRTLSSEDGYVALAAPLAEDPAVTSALSVRLTDEVFTALEVEDRIEQAIASIPNVPSAASVLAGPIATGAHDLVLSQVEEFLGSDSFAVLWTELNRGVHTKLVALLNGDYDELPNLENTGGAVQLNLISVVAEVIQRVAQSGADALGFDVTVPSIPPDLESSAAIQRLGSALGVTLPDDFGQVTIMSADQLAGYQDALRLVKQLIGALVVLSLVLLALTIVVAPNRRRIVMWLAAGVTMTLFLGGVFLRRIESRVIDAITDPGARAAAEDIFIAVRNSLRAFGLVVLVVAIVAGIVAYLAGRPRWVTRALDWARQATSNRPQGTELEVWVARHPDEVRIGGLALGAGVLFLTGIDWLPVAIVAGMVGLAWWGVAVAKRRAETSSDGSLLADTKPTGSPAA